MSTTLYPLGCLVLLIQLTLFQGFARHSTDKFKVEQELPSHQARTAAFPLLRRLIKFPARTLVIIPSYSCNLILYLFPYCSHTTCIIESHKPIDTAPIQNAITSTRAQLELRRT